MTFLFYVSWFQPSFALFGFNVGETFLEIFCDMYYVPRIILVDTVVKAFSESIVSFSLFSHVQKKHEQKKNGSGMSSISQ